MPTGKRSILVIILICCSFYLSNYITVNRADFPETITTIYSFDPYKTERNPLRGFFPYIGEYDRFNYSLEFFYIPLTDLMNDFDSYTFDKVLEPNLEEIATRSNQAIFRVYLDYPEEETGIPDFLLNGLTTFSYDEYGGGISPDYTNETLISALESFIEELGKQYDGDERIGFLQLGLLGHWGEWHTYPHEDWFPEEEIQNRILYAFDKAFNKTKLVVRYPAADSPLLNIGYHDDSFAYETIGSEEWQFYNRLLLSREDQKWQKESIGGEVRPEIQENLWNVIPPLSAQDYYECVNLTHASWLLNHDLFESSFTEKQFERAIDGALALGYQFFVQKVEANAIGDSLKITIEMKNTGNAPFYYPLDLKAGIDDEYVEFVGYSTVIENINLLPRELETYNLDLPFAEITNESKISFKLESDYVFKSIFFANFEVNDDGSLDLRPTTKTTEKTSNQIQLIMLVSSLIVISVIKRKKQTEVQ